MGAGSQPSKERDKGVKETKNNRNSHEVSTKSGVQIAPCKSRLRDMPAAILATKHFAFYHGPKWYGCVSTHSNHGQIALQKKRNTFDEAEINNLPTKARDQDIKAWRRLGWYAAGVYS